MKLTERIKLVGGLLIIIGTTSLIIAGFNYSTHYTGYWVNEWNALRLFSLLWALLSFVMVISGILLLVLSSSEELPQIQAEE